ncbi:Rieske 2Fe-2S domain-containing protein [Aquiflexum sp. LQ15W]|uniref:Rieske (2Fe-2S) protein n=1 Tax=Cognataquiflexum nitidum TaxID=2922272 RepID=UPI001F143A07|nr:Rieske 2Fe-2S domain-containing protein [Cognataquiflexum nitidum]MCH6200553.1 Rieske 2Fe-2S domain-containing protein [Cognataquiflexum nitidum]
MKTFILGQSKEQVFQMIPEKRIKLVQLGGEKICISRNGDAFFAFEPFCPHRMASLIQGTIVRNEIVCPLHQYRFDMQTGAVVSGQCPDLKVYKVELSDRGLAIWI